MRKISKKRAAQLREYARVREKFLRENSECELCHGPSSEVHHRKSRSGVWLNDTHYFMAVCRSCHVRIETNSKESLENGWKLIRSA